MSKFLVLTLINAYAYILTVDQLKTIATSGMNVNLSIDHDLLLLSIPASEVLLNNRQISKAFFAM